MLYYHVFWEISKGYNSNNSEKEGNFFVIGGKVNEIVLFSQFAILFFDFTILDTFHRRGYFLIGRLVKTPMQSGLNFHIRTTCKEGKGFYSHCLYPWQSTRGQNVPLLERRTWRTVLSFHS